MVIGELSRRTQVKVATIRYYETIGLLPPPDRTDGRHRRYDHAVSERLTMIRNARDLGFEIETIREMLLLHDASVGSPQEAEAVVSRCLDQARQKAVVLAAFETELRRVQEAYRHGRRATFDPLRALTHGSASEDLGGPEGA